MDFYQILGVAYDDPPEKIKARFRLLAFAVHPDTGEVDRAGELTRYAQAYRTLGNPTRRELYNKELGIFVRPRRLRSGVDLYQLIEISLTQAEAGGVVPLMFTRYEPCSLCWLAGCGRCNYEKMIPDQVCVEVKVAPGIRNGAKVLIEGEGSRSEPGGNRGHLFVYIRLFSLASLPYMKAKI